MADETVETIYDITPPITERIRVWPGDTPFSREVLCDRAPPRRDNITLSTIRSTVHLGAHADGPNHYAYPATGIGERNLKHYLGPCHVLSAAVQRGTRVKLSDVRWPGAGTVGSVRYPRVLLRTDSFPDPDNWNDDFAGLEPDLIDAMGSRGVITIGVDTPSVDLQNSKDLPAHAACARADISIVEGLMLQGVPDGAYELIALPLRLIGIDASPVRAVLRTLPQGA